MARVADGFNLRRELGAKLRELRLKAGLSLEQTAHQMGRHRGYAARLSQLEQGKVRFPGFGLVMDYLRVCRARLSDLGPALDSYTDKRVPLELAGDARVRAATRDLPPKVARALVSYDISTTLARESGGQKPLEPDERELRIRKQAQAWLERGRLDRAVHTHMDELGVLPLLTVRKSAFDYAHKLWRILRTTRAVPGPAAGRRRKPRAVRLAEAEAQAARDGAIPLSGLELIGRVAVDLFQRMEKLGELDNLPALAAVPFFEKPLSARLRIRASAGGAPVRELPYRAEYLASIKLEAMRQMEQQGLAGDRLQRYLQWLGRVEAVALETGPGSAERDQRIDDLVKSTSDPALSRRVADLYVAVFERWRPRLFK